MQKFKLMEIETALWQLAGIGNLVEEDLDSATKESKATNLSSD
jgi:hypothetical protein